MAVYGPVRHQKNIIWTSAASDQSIYCHMTLSAMNYLLYNKQLYFIITVIACAYSVIKLRHILYLSQTRIWMLICMCCCLFLFIGLINFYFHKINETQTGHTYAKGTAISNSKQISE